MATSWVTPTMFVARWELMEILAAKKMFTVLKITTLTPDHCWKIMSIIEMPKGTRVFFVHNSLFWGA